MTQQSAAISNLFANPKDGAAIQSTLDTVRKTLGMEVAYLSEFVKAVSYTHLTLPTTPYV